MQDVYFAPRPDYVAQDGRTLAQAAYGYPRTSIVASTLYGDFTAVPVLMSGQPDAYEVWYAGGRVGYVQYDLETYKFAVRSELHGKRNKIEWRSMGEAVEMLQIVAMMRNDPKMYSATV